MTTHLRCWLLAALTASVAGEGTAHAIDWLLGFSEESARATTAAVGDTLDFKGPIVKLPYKPNQYKEIGMVAGGTGIAPMLQVVDEILADKADKTKVSLIFANQTEEDILVRDELEKLVEEHPTRFKLHYTLDRPPANWTGSTGFISTDMIESHLPPPGDDTVVLMCGPPPMIKFACKANLDKLNYPKNRQLAF